MIRRERAIERMVRRRRGEERERYCLPAKERLTLYEEERERGGFQII